MHLSKVVSFTVLGEAVAQCHQELSFVLADSFVQALHCLNELRGKFADGYYRLKWLEFFMK